MRTDPNEWHNLASEPKYVEVIREHQRWLPKSNAKPALGSANRLLTYENGRVTWEGEPVGPEDPIPEQ